MSHVHHDEISLSYFKKDFEKYSWSYLRQDALAGLSVAMLTVPQAMAYALVAGLPISAGLFAAIFSAIVVALLGSSRHLIVGPSNAIAIMVQAGISGILFTYYREVTGPEKEVLVLQILTQLAFLVGMIQILAAFFKLGRLTHFVSHSVIVGYVSGVALALVINQLFTLLGMSIPKGVDSLYERGAYIITHIHEVHGPTAAIGIICLAVIFIFKRIDRKMPAGAIMLVGVALFAYTLDYFLSYVKTHEFHLFDPSIIERLVGDVVLIGDTKADGLLPHWDWPYFNTRIMNNLLPVAFAISLLGVIEATSTAKSIAANSGQRLSTNQEIFALGAGNFFSAFIGAMPISGSNARSSFSYDSGARTRLASIFNSLSVAILLFAFGFLIKCIPLAAFAALLIASCANMINVKQILLCLKATRSDASVLSLTFLSCLFFSLDMAFYIGVILSITLYLKKAAIPQLVEFTVDEAGNLHSLDHIHAQEPRTIRFIKVEGELFFGAADLFQSTLKSITEDDTTTRVIILQMKNARDIDATACLALQQLYDYLQNSGRYLIGCGLTHQIWNVLSDSGMIDLIGKENLFIFDEKHPQFSVQRAFARARELLALPEQVKPAAEELAAPLASQPLAQPSEASPLPDYRQARSES